MFKYVFLVTFSTIFILSISNTQHEQSLSLHGMTYYSIFNIWVVKHLTFYQNFTIIDTYILVIRSLRIF